MSESRWNGPSGRIEALTDTVFGFSITLLVVSLEVPDTYADLLNSMGGFVAFGLSFTLLILVWYYHYRLFRRYPMDDGMTVLLNSLLLFVVLFYVYPLKFVSTLLVSIVTGQMSTDPRNIPALMAIYSSGFVLVFLVFTLMYLHAYRRREALGLDRFQALEARESQIDCLLMTAVGVLSVISALALPMPWNGPVAGMIYFLVWPFQAFASRRFQRRRQEMLATPAGPQP